MDLAPIIGIILGIAAIIVGQTLEGGHIQSIIQPTAALIVLGGTLGATTLGYSISDLLRGVKMGLSIFFNPSDKPEPLIQDIVKLANVVRKEGILALEQQQSGITDSFLRMGIRYAIDGLEPTMTR
jgi:chemotaxis protein MotA